ncbi:DUF3010 family protein [Dyadobacter psychrotolerans]|uniref:DUF3010 family protein n=1 Tax=Dyadobacter psychrotolerans TaxID=2541721 RepID=A0A4V2Z2B7_9BACT|nr:DUF3010 family protein [Dyadobacter psychrotolerans]TDE08178.1 DUF3010 family protein [Dyadobacter psychrotolerans]
MKTIGIEIESNEAIIAVLEQDEGGNLSQVTKECVKLDIGDSMNSGHVKQFRDQIDATFNAISPDKISSLSRNISGPFASSPLTFKIEGIIQLYQKVTVELVSSKTVKAFLKKKENEIAPKFKYQTNALNLAFYLIKQHSNE